MYSNIFIGTSTSTICTVYSNMFISNSTCTICTVMFICTNNSTICTVYINIMHVCLLVLVLVHYVLCIVICL